MVDNPGRKRKRSEHSTHQLPSIPGVPADVTPFFVEALRQATKYFERATTPYSLLESSTAPEYSAPAVRKDVRKDDSVVDNLMSRVEASSTKKNEDAIQLEQSHTRMQEAAQAWLSAVKRYLRNNRRAQEGESSSERQSVPFSCFLYIWALQQDHGRIVVRRAALFLSGLLLQKSSECRFHLEEGTHLSTWLSSVVAQKTIWKNPEQAAIQLPLWQREAHMLLSYLIEQGYGELYPKIGVAQKLLRQQCPSLEASASSSSTNMVDWRRFRDLALKFGNKEIQLVEKLVYRAHGCLDVLVPRLGEDAKEGNPKESVDDEDGEEDDDIHWEDGDGVDGNGDFEESHAAAVARTLAVMESSGGLRGGELEIDFGSQKDEGPAEQAPGNPQCIGRLQTCVQLLNQRHRPRLTAWVEGLTNADNLMLECSSLVLLPSDTMRKRNELLERLLELKRVISSVLSAASRLEVTTKDKDDGHTRVSEPRQAVASNLAGARRRLPLICSFRRQQAPKVARRNRSKIRIIKYRST
jgi:hypothetical protein